MLHYACYVCYACYACNSPAKTLNKNLEFWISCQWPASTTLFILTQDRVAHRESVSGICMHNSLLVPITIYCDTCIVGWYLLYLFQKYTLIAPQVERRISWRKMVGIVRAIWVQPYMYYCTLCQPSFISQVLAVVVEVSAVTFLRLLGILRRLQTFSTKELNHV